MPIGPVPAQGGHRRRNVDVGSGRAAAAGSAGVAGSSGVAGSAATAGSAAAAGSSGVASVAGAAASSGVAGMAGAGGAARPGSQPRLTSRGCGLVMFVVFLVSGLLAQRLSAGWVAGLGYGAGCLLAVAFARRGALLFVVTTPPLIFLVALVCVQLITATGSTLLATAEGTVLALAAASGWLFACTAGCIVVAVLRGLPQCIRDLSAEMNGRPARQAAGSPAAAAAPRQLGPGPGSSGRLGPGPRRLELDAGPDDDTSPDGLSSADDVGPAEPGADA
jgi:hypothetical protein